MNHFVACGGTGAHVMLAMVRLHILGRPFGFFCGKKGANFPDLFLVDQDSGLATKNGDMTTAWGEVNKLVKEHPGRHQPQKYFGVNRKLRLSKLTPLPVDVKGDWYEAPNGTLEKRFVHDKVISLITTDYQRKEIDYSRGMMASPAMGSLLFALKEYDKVSQESQIMIRTTTHCSLVSKIILLSYVDQLLVERGHLSHLLLRTA